jgi:hypothetical protein
MPLQAQDNPNDNITGTLDTSLRVILAMDKGSTGTKGTNETTVHLYL